MKLEVEEDIGETLGIVVHYPDKSIEALYFFPSYLIHFLHGFWISSYLAFSYKGDTFTLIFNSRFMIL